MVTAANANLGRDATRALTAVATGAGVSLTPSCTVAFPKTRHPSCHGIKEELSALVKRSLTKIVSMYNILTMPSLTLITGNERLTPSCVFEYKI